MPNNGPVDRSFENEGVLGPNDDGSTGFIGLGQVFETGLNFFGQSYNGLFVNNNGNVTLGNQGANGVTGSPLGTFTPFGLTGATNRPIIAPFFADVDTRNGESAVVTYDTGTYNGVQAFNVLWDGVGYFSGQANKLNVFQLVIAERTDVGSGDFDIYFNYNQIQWEAGSASGGSNGLGGTSAAVGYSAGSGMPGTFAQLQGSFQNGAFLDNGPNSLANGTNNGVPGQYLFQVRNGAVNPTPQPETPRPEVVVQSGITLGVGSAAPMREGNDGPTAFTFTVTRSGDLTQASTATWTVGIDDAGDLAEGQALSGEVGFGVGQTATAVTVLVAGDRIFEGDEMFSFALTSATHAGVTFNPGAGGVAIILNDDAPVLYQFTGPVMAAEGVLGATPFDFSVLRIGDLTRASSVKWRLDLGQTTSDDFAPGQAREGVLSFAAGERTGVITIQVAGDIRAETDETFNLTLFEGTLNSVTTRFNTPTTGTILDDDIRRTVLVSNATTLVKTEGDSGATDFTFNLTRVGDLTRAGAANYTITLPAGGASAGEILTPLTGTVNFAAGQAEAVLTVQTAADLVSEANESFLIALGGGDFNLLNLTGVIMNDDDATGSASAPRPPAAPDADADPSSFMKNLMGGGLWADGAL